MLRHLHTDKFNVTIVSPRNYFLFTPLLPSATVGTLEVRSIMEPIRYFLKRSSSDTAKFIEAECVSIDHKAKTISCEDLSEVKGSVSKFSLPYDQLVIAVGAQVRSICRDLLIFLIDCNVWNPRSTRTFRIHALHR